MFPRAFLIGLGLHRNYGGQQKHFNVQLGPHPYFLVDTMDEGPLKKELQKCSECLFKQTDWVFAHRGGPLQFPEHTEELYRAGAREGAGVIECDVAFTKDKKLVCRHSQCDLHTTTDPFTSSINGTPADALCCTSDITEAEFKTLCGKMDGFNLNATTVEEYMDGTPYFRTGLYSTCGKLMTHDESIRLIDSLGFKFTTELKTPNVKMPFDSYTQEQYAQDLIDAYKKAGIHPSRVWPQSFLLDDILLWIKNEPKFGKQPVYLDERVDTSEGCTNATASIPDLAKKGNKVVLSEYALAVNKAGMEIVTWSFERSGWLNKGGDYYYQYVKNVINNDGDTYMMLDVLVKQVGIKAIFSDWPATTVYYANCFNL
ncbi:glycerophosphoryl diester phosphodiesterase [Zopfia rhizophila CBS 207.26]|uniref:glycerophosphodiester phosphodiesterase n=1 Tax=Zopfia rhizophila CBS 207.26 TaxID=1314779 RepID=A0A6A6E5S5_9PEZI|nr:glycerophosphoryl diester phosphodiesterase [Zopfia rhizophila CBS 207.26]